MKKIALLSLVFVLAGCNKIRLTYQYADWMVLYSVRDNFDLNSEQSEQLSQEVDDYFLWNRKEMLPLYARYLHASAEKIRSGLDSATYDSGYAEFRALYRQSLLPVVDKAQTLLLSLEPDQIDAYAKTLKKKNDKLRREISRPREEILEKRYLKSIKAIEDWTGPLSVDQKARLKPLNDAMPWTGDIWLANREKVQAELIDLLKTKAGAAKLRPFLEDYFLDGEKLRSPVYLARSREYQAGLKRYLLELRSILTPAQLERLLEQMKTLANDFDVLHAKG
jgi:hypothetical protein